LEKEELTSNLEAGSGMRRNPGAVLQTTAGESSKRIERRRKMSKVL
jgi:hypothetical protein